MRFGGCLSHNSRIYSLQAANFPPSTADPTKHGVRGRTGNRKASEKLMEKRQGVMYALGWHGSMEPDKTLVSYAPTKVKNEESLAMFAIFLLHCLC